MFYSTVFQERRLSIWIYTLAGFLLIPALLINLGLLTFIDDEAIRSLVALEMMLSGNYITPTLHGEFYYNKPPLFNWIIILFFRGFGQVNEFVARLPTVFAIFGYGATIYFFVRKHLGDHTALLAAFLFITCGRMLFYDSLLALIDITFSWCIFTLFMVIFHYLEKEKYLTLFILTYTLTAVGFLFKGLPAVVFQGITLLAYFSYRKKFWQLFSWQHVVGGLCFMAVLGSYYLTYHQYNDLGIVAQTLFTESSKRTAVTHGMGKTIQHLFTFPFELIYHFLPWSLLVVYLFHRSTKELLQASAFIRFCIIAFLANIIIYWVSVEVYPRYLLMLMPLVFILFAHLHSYHSQQNTIHYTLLRWLFLVPIVAIVLMSFLPVILEQTQETPDLWVKTLSLILGLSIIAYAYWKLPGQQMPIMVLFLIVFRIGFDWFVLPDRNANDFGDVCRQTSRQVGAAYKSSPLQVWDAKLMQPTNSFYLTNERGAIIPQLVEADKQKLKEENGPSNQEGYLIVPPKVLTTTTKVDEIKLRHGRLTYDVVGLEE